MDYGKYKYDQKKKASKAKKNQTKIEIKEVKFRSKTEKHDFDVKVNRIERFLKEGKKVKATVMFKGREIIHSDLGLEILDNVAKQLEEISVIESQPKLERRNMFMILTSK